MVQATAVAFCTGFDGTYEEGFIMRAFERSLALSSFVSFRWKRK
jgi:hypothetical protein